MRRRIHEALLVARVEHALHFRLLESAGRQLFDRVPEISESDALRRKVTLERANVAMAKVAVDGVAMDAA